MTPITLNDGEILAAETISAKRVELNAANKNLTNRQRDSSRSNYDVLLQGALGERAYAKAHNLCNDYSVLAVAGSADLKDRDGKLVDVKTASQPGSPLRVEVAASGANTELYALVIGPLGAQQNEFQVVGTVPPEIVFQAKNVVKHTSNPSPKVLFGGKLLAAERKSRTWTNYEVPYDEVAWYAYNHF